MVSIKKPNIYDAAKPSDVDSLLDDRMSVRVMKHPIKIKILRDGQ